MNRKTALLFVLLLLGAFTISGCGRNKAEATPIPFTPTFTPTPGAPIVIQFAPNRPGAPGQAPAGGQLVPPPVLNQPSGIVVTPTPVVLEGASATVSDQSSADANTVVNTVSATTVAAPVATPVATTSAEDDSTLNAATAPAPAIESATGAAPSGPGEQLPDIASIAAELGVTEDALQAAVGEQGQGPPDFAAIAAELGVTEDALVEAFGGPQRGGPQAGGPPTN